MNGRSYRERPAWPLLAGLALLALLVLAAFSCGGATGEQRAKDPTADDSQTGADEARAGANLEHPSLGNEDAPVVMTEYADYQ